MELLTRRVLLLANPASRRGGRYHQAALDAFRRAGVKCDGILTEYAGHAAELCAGAAAHYDAVFVLGGDGTAMEVIGALAGRGPPVGILPGGTGNLIARSLGIPLRIAKAVELLLNSPEACIDLGQLSTGQHFAFAAGVGIDARMVEETPPWLKRRIGILAYMLTATRAVLRGNSFLVRVTVDGEVLERQASMVMVTNFGTVLNELVVLGPGIRQDDGQLDLCVFSPGSLIDAVRIAWRLFRKDFRADPCMLYRRGREFTLETEPPMLSQADGELIGMTPIAVRVEPRAARLLVPNGSLRLQDASPGLRPSRDEHPSPVPPGRERSG